MRTHTSDKTGGIIFFGLKLSTQNQPHNNKTETNTPRKKRELLSDSVQNQ